MKLPVWLRKTIFVDLYLYFKNKYRVKYIVESKTISITDVCFWEYKHDFRRPGEISNWCMEFCVGRWEYIDPTHWAFSHEEDATLFKITWGLL